MKRSTKQKLLLTRVIDFGMRNVSSLECFIQLAAVEGLDHG